MTEPAMTAEEWEGASERHNISGGFDLDWTTYDAEGARDRHRSLGAHAVAAAMLHGQPFGFTWTDVDELRGVAEWLADEGWAESDLTSMRRFRDLADRIAALLPPRTV